MSFSQNLFLIIEIICLLLSSELCTDVSANTFHWNSNNNQDTPQWQRNAQQNSAVCVDIPSNLTLCQGIGYTKMRLPNLLNHDTLREVSQQSNSWVPLSQLNCHPDTQLFLCSLFSPVCLDHPIPPCRSLCLSVQTSCEHVMLNYGYPWPKIVQCDQFPIDNDMCIQAQHLPPAVQTLSDKKPITSNQHTDRKPRKGHKKGGHNGKKQRRNQSIEPAQADDYPPAIKETVYEPQPGHLQRPSQLDSETRMKEEPQVDQVITTQHQTTERPVRKWNKEQRQLYNDIINNFCRSQWILKARLYPINQQKSEIKVRNYRLIQGSIQEQQRQTPIVLSANRTVVDSVLSQQTPDETQTVLSRRRYFIIGKTEQNGENWVTFIMQWPHKSAQLRKAIKAINGGDYNCQTADNSQQLGTNSEQQPKDRHNRDKSRRNNNKDKNKVNTNS